MGKKRVGGCGQQLQQVYFFSIGNAKFIYKVGGSMLKILLQGPNSRFGGLAKFAQ